MNDTLELQKELDVTTKAQAQRILEGAVVVQIWDNRHTMILPSGIEVEVTKYGSMNGVGLDHFKKGEKQIPIADFISELEAIIAEVKQAHGLAPIEWSFPDEQFLKHSRQLKHSEIGNEE